MNRDMKKWLSDMIATEHKKALPILSFPSVQLLNISVRELISNSDIQAEGMRLVAKKTNASASVSLMDLSVEAECFGATVRFSEDEVPTIIGQLIHNEDEANSLEIPEVGKARTGIYVDAIRKASESICDRPVFAGMIGPFSLAARLLNVTEIMMDCYDEPELVHLVLKKCTTFLINYARAYKEAGADGIVIAEPVAGLLSPSLEEEFSSPYVKCIVDEVQDDGFIVVYHNCGGNTPKMIGSILSIGASAYHFGNAVDMQEILKNMPQSVLVMGNVDPAGQICRGTVESVKEATLEVMKKCCSYPNFIISSGCDIPPKSPWQNINAFFDAVEEFYV